jgi:hypothetical protein
MARADYFRSRCRVLRRLDADRLPMTGLFEKIAELASARPPPAGQIDPKSISISIFGAKPTSLRLTSCRRVGVDRASVYFAKRRARYGAPAAGQVRGVDPEGNGHPRQFSKRDTSLRGLKRSIRRQEAQE